MKTIVPTIDLQKFENRGWVLVKTIGGNHFGGRPKDCLVEKPDSELDEADIERFGKYRGG